MPHGGTLHALLAIVTACVVAPATALDYDAAMNASQAAVGRTLDDYAFTDGDGRRVRLADFRGKPLVVSFIYTGCGQVCPTTTKFVDRVVGAAADASGTAPTQTIMATTTAITPLTTQPRDVR